MEAVPAPPRRPDVDAVRLIGRSRSSSAGPQAFAWVIVVQIWANIGITMVIFLAGMQTIPQELIDAAQVDGASRWQLFRNVTWPLLTPASTRTWS